MSELTLADKQSVRILLRGDSVIDWHRLAFADHSEVDRFLRLNEFDPESEDLARLEDLRGEAIDYLGRAFSITLPDAIAEALPVRDLFLVASSDSPHQRLACVVLKVMHIIHHIAGRAGLLKISVSDEIIFREVELKVMHVVEVLRAGGAPIAEFEWSRKSRDSQITKLLAKRSTVAANIYDKIRFRLIVPNESDIVPMLATLTRQLVPFNYVVPGESVNQLIELDTLQAASAQASNSKPHNEFSGRDYRIINFVADLPLRVDRILPAEEIPPDMCHVVFVLTEFQIVDKATAQRNESASSSHEAYKARQRERVRTRLFRQEDDPIVPE